MGNSETSEVPPDLCYHVLQVAPNSPGEVAGLVSYFDFISSVNGTPLEKEDKFLEEVLKNNVGKEVSLVVYNSRSEKYRPVTVTPSDTWGGAGVAGISIRFCPFVRAAEHVWHVLDVHDKGPAAMAGLESHTDYIVGTPDLLFNDSEDLYTLIRNSIDQTVQLYIFSSKTNRVRLVNIIPSRTWGGNGCLGCDIGYGYLHQIPTPAAFEETTPSVLLFEPSQPYPFAPQMFATPGSEGLGTSHILTPAAFDFPQARLSTTPDTTPSSVEAGTKLETIPLHDGEGSTSALSGTSNV